MGKYPLFTNLSDPIGQSFSACQYPSMGDMRPDQVINAAGAFYEDAITALVVCLTDGTACETLRS
jgi:hypothetical protein